MGPFLGTPGRIAYVHNDSMASPHKLLDLMRLLLVLGVGALAAACADDDVAPIPDGARVIILPVDPSAELDGNFTLRVNHKVAGGLAEETVYPLQPVSGHQPGLYVAPGAPTGMYNVVNDRGWGLIWLARAAPRLSADPQDPITQVQMGRACTLFVRAREYPAEDVVGGQWIVERSTWDEAGVETREAVPFEREEVASFLALRFTPETYHGELRVTGQYASGALPQPRVVEVRGGSRAPRVLFTTLAARSPLLLLIDPAPGAERPTMVAQRMEGLPFTVGDDLELPKTRAIVQRLAVPEVGTGIRFEIGSQAYVVSNEAWRGSGSVLLSVLPPGEPESVGAGDEAAERVLVRWPGGTSFGRLPHAEDRTRWVTVRKAQTLWYLGAETWRSETRNAEGRLVGEPEVGAYGEFRGRLAPSAEPLRLVIERIEGDERIQIDGCDVPVLAGRPVTRHLVPGTYEASTRGLATDLRSKATRFEVAAGTTVIRTIAAP